MDSQQRKRLDGLAHRWLVSERFRRASVFLALLGLAAFLMGTYEFAARFISPEASLDLYRFPGILMSTPQACLVMAVIGVSLMLLGALAWQAHATLIKRISGGIDA